LALFEQSVFKAICEIANEFRDPAEKKKYVEAAHRFRIPQVSFASTFFRLM